MYSRPWAKNGAHRNETADHLQPLITTRSQQVRRASTARRYLNESRGPYPAFARVRKHESCV